VIAAPRSKHFCQIGKPTHSIRTTLPGRCQTNAGKLFGHRHDISKAFDQICSIQRRLLYAPCPPGIGKLSRISQLIIIESMWLRYKE
jgi:hypothetical protein